MLRVVVWGTGNAGRSAIRDVASHRDLELVGHDFFVFQNAETAEVNVVYRRRDGAYGLIEPQT